MAEVYGSFLHRKLSCELIKNISDQTTAIESEVGHSELVVNKLQQFTEVICIIPVKIVAQIHSKLAGSCFGVLSEAANQK